MNTNSVFIVAEMSANHNGSKKNAIETIKAAKRAGADAIKLQTYTADTLTLDSKKKDFKITQGTLWDGVYLYDLYKEAYTPWEWHEELFHVASEEGIVCFSSPFDQSAVDLLETLNTPIYKIASPEIVDIPLIEYAASTMKPIVLSTGVATREDISLAIATCRKAGNQDITVLKCTTAYPAPVEEANLCMLRSYSEEFGVKVGLSDHTLGHIAATVAVSLGAVMIEKHFITDRTIGGVDAAFSMDEREFTEMVDTIRQVEAAIGHVSYDLSPKALTGRDFIRSLYVAEDMEAGDVITEKNVRSVRPGYGLHPKYLPELLGKKVNRKLDKGTRFTFDLINS